MFTIRIVLAAAAFPAVARAAELSGFVLGPITPVYQGDETGTTFKKPDWFPDSQFPLVWGGPNEPDTNLSWWIARHGGGFLMDHAVRDGVWLPPGPADSPDDRGTWIQDVYRPVDIDPSLRGQTVRLQIYPDKGTYGSPAETVEHVIDDDYLVAFTHIEDWSEVQKKVINGSRTLYSFDNGRNWKKGPRRAMSICAIDNRTNPARPRLIKLWQHAGVGWRTITTDIAKGVDGYTNNSGSYYHGNSYGFSNMVWSRYLNRWLLVWGENGSHGKNLQFLTTQDFETFVKEPSVSIEKNEIPGRGVVGGAGDYPTLLGGFPRTGVYPTPFNKEVGQLGWVYNKRGGLSGRAIHFIKAAEKPITWQGADAATSAKVEIVPELPAAASAPIFLGGNPVADLDDEDGDGVPNLMEYATGTPLGEANAMPGALALDAGEIHFTFTRDTAAAVRPVAEWSDTLLPGDWKTEGITEEILSVAAGIETIRASLPRPESGRRFLRLRVTRESAAPKDVNEIAAGPVDFGGGVTLTVLNTEISAPGHGSAVWTFTRAGSTEADLPVSFGVTGSAVFPGDFTVAGTTSFTGTTGSVAIPAGQESVSFTTTAADAGAGKSIVLSVPGALNLATVANWNQSGGGFTGIVDESHTLDFNSAAGGTFHNDIPGNKRVRSINFGGASGDHIINGNAIELEAVNKGYGSGNYAAYSINQHAAKTATFNTDIRTRSAALYLRSWPAGGKIVLNGTTDMLGTGGVVVSGEGDVEINGDLIDSGYHDFATGQPELVAGVNPGRLIMVGDGTLSLAGNNTFDGRTEIKYGTVRIDSENALRNSVVTLAKHDALVSTTDFRLGGLDGKGNLDLADRNLTLGNHNRPDCYSTNHTGVIRGSGSVTKVDANTQRLGAVNLHTGGTVVKGGVLEVPGSSNTAFGSGTITLDGGTLRPAGPLVTGNPVHIGPAGGTVNTNGRTVTLSGPLSGTGTLTATGSGMLALGDAGTFSGTLVSQGNLRLDQPDALGTGALELGGKLVLAADQYLSGLTTTSANASVDTGPHTLTIDGPISVAAGHRLTKSGSGAIVWDGSSSSLTGDLVVNGGTLATTRSGDLSHGNLTLAGASLALSAAAEGADIAIAREPGTRFEIQGAARLFLDRGEAASLDVTLGSAENPDAFVLGDSSVVTARLGEATRLFSPGEPDTAAGGIFSPAFVLASPDRGSDFAVYSAAQGFTRFTGYTGRAGNWSVPAGQSEIAEITANATLTADSGVKSLRLSGNSKLTLTSRVLTLTGEGGKAGLVLNNGSLTGGTVTFGENKGYIHTGGPDAAIASAIRGTGGIVVAGEPGTKVTLTSWATGYSGRLTVAGTTLVLPNITVMGESGTPFTIDGRGTLSFPNTVSVTREITLASGGGIVHVGGGATFTNSGTFTGSGELRKTGPGTLKRSGGGAATGPVVVEEGLLDYSAAATHGSTGPITVEAGARVNLSTNFGSYFNHDLTLAGTGPSGEGALSVNSGGKTTNTVVLSGDARIRANSGAFFSFEGPIFARGHALDFSGPGRIALHGVIDADGADLTLSGTPYLSVKSTASVACDRLVTAAGSTFELNTANTRIGEAAISGTLNGAKGVITGPVTLLSGGTLTGGHQETPDLLTIDSDLTLSAGSTCRSYIKGPTGASSDGTGSKYGQILVTGTGTIGGRLLLEFDPAYTPATGDEIHVMLRNGGSGAFDEVEVSASGATASFSGAQGTVITVGGKTAVLRYNAHSSINLSDPSTAFDISIRFQ